MKKINVEKDQAKKMDEEDGFEFLFKLLGYQDFKVRKWQTEFVNLVKNFLYNGEDRGLLYVAIVGANGCGKSAIVAMMLIYYLAHHMRHNKACLGKIISGKYSQLEGSIISHLERLINRMRPAAQDTFQLSRKGIFIEGYENNKITFESWASQHEQSLAGTHEGNVIMCVDEASEPTDNTFTVLKGNMTDCKGILIYTGNPVRASGEFYDVFSNSDRTDWHKFEIDYWQGLDGREDNGWADSMRREYGSESREYINRVLGQFWLGGNDRLVPEVYLEMAIDPYAKIHREPLGYAISVDVATDGGVDNTVITVYDGYCILESIVHNTDLYTLAKILISYMMKFHTGINQGKLSHVVIDAVGVGYGLRETILSLIGWTDVAIINFKANEQPLDKERFENQMAECAWKAREWLGDGGKIDPRHKELIADIRLIHTTFENRKRKLGLVSKKHLKKSPDFFDSFVMLFVVDLKQKMLRNYQEIKLENNYSTF